jgi:hypothetical protein
MSTRARRQRQGADRPKWKSRPVSGAGDPAPHRAQLDSSRNIVTVKKLVAFYVIEHNETLPHSAFEGQTPDEVYFGRGAQVPDELAARRHAARRERVARNRSAACSACPRAAPVSDDGVAA